MERTVVPALDAILGKEFPVLDKGFVRLVDYMGDDTSVVQAARISYGKGTTTPARDKGLLSYLLRHKHTSPFEMCEIKLHLKMPIFIARQWVRHRTANINEFSARYSFVPDDAYIPYASILGVQSATNHQATIPGTLSDKESSAIIERIQTNTKNAYDTYLWCVNSDKDKNSLHAEHQGLSRELARMNLSLNHYTQWYWKCDLHNLLHFLHLRAAPGAQKEIQLYAECIIENILKLWVPWTYDAFLEYRVGSVSFSRSARVLLQDLINNNPIQTRESYGLTETEWREVWEAVGHTPPSDTA